jgi:hypothetical protein
MAFSVRYSMVHCVLLQYMAQSFRTAPYLFKKIRSGVAKSYCLLLYTAVPGAAIPYDTVMWDEAMSSGARSDTERSYVICILLYAVVLLYCSLFTITLVVYCIVLRG